MKVQDLITQLKWMNPESEVRLAMKRVVPVEYSIGKIIDPRKYLENESANEIVSGKSHKRIKNVVYICEGKLLGYLSDWITELAW